MSDRTPGPWSVYGGGAITGGTNVMGDLVDLIVVGADRFPVAELPLTAILPDYPERTGHSHWAHGPGEAYVEREVEVVCANARLIAAAPDLLAVCVAAEEILYHTLDGGSCEADCECVLHDLRAAIAKARGEQP